MSPHEPAPIFGLVMAGGQSRRMGVDKASIAYRGEPEVRRMYSVLRLVCDAAYVSVRPDQADGAVFAGLPKIVDAVNAAGPIAGVLTAMQAHPESAWLVVGCDMPLLDVPALRALIAARDTGAPVTAYRAGDGQAEPLCAIYEPAARDTLDGAVARGDFGLRRALAGIEVRLVAPERGVTASANTPEERDALRARVHTTDAAPCK